MVLEDVPAGVELDLDLIAAEMARRAPGKSPLSTPRKEADQPEILSGLFEGRTTGTPLCAIIRNSDQHSKDYAATKNLARPGHADYTGHVRYHGCNDYRGGGHFSGRLTAPLVFAGAVAKQVLARRGIYVGAHISQIEYCRGCAPLLDEERQLTPDAVPDAGGQRAFPAAERCQTARGHAERRFWQAREQRDSVGGAIECAILGLEPGVGAPDLGP